MFAPPPVTKRRVLCRLAVKAAAELVDCGSLFQRIPFLFRQRLYRLLKTRWLLDVSNIGSDIQRPDFGVWRGLWAVPAPLLNKRRHRHVRQPVKLVAEQLYLGIGFPAIHTAKNLSALFYR